jgi:hypothetical protein
MPITKDTSQSKTTKYKLQHIDEAWRTTAIDEAWEQKKEFYYYKYNQT